MLSRSAMCRTLAPLLVALSSACWRRLAARFWAATAGRVIVFAIAFAVGTLGACAASRRSRHASRCLTMPSRIDSISAAIARVSRTVRGAPAVSRSSVPSHSRAAVSGLALKAVNNAIDKHIVDIVRPAAAGRRTIRRYLTPTHLVCLRLEHGLVGRLPVERQQGLFREVAAKPEAKRLNADDLLLVDIGEARRQVAERVRDLDEAEQIIHIDKDTLAGEPVFKGTRIPIYGLAAMLEAGATPDELIAGHSKLDHRKLGLARLWAAAHPRRGRPKRLIDFGFTLKSTTRRRLPADPLKAPPASGSSTS